MSAKAVDVRHAIDQANAALGIAGLAENDIFRAELSAARAAVVDLMKASRALYVITAGVSPNIDANERADLGAALTRCGVQS